MRVSCKEAAWIVATRLFRAEIVLDSQLSRKVGHPVFIGKGKAYPEYRVEEYSDRLDVHMGKVSYMIRIRNIDFYPSGADLTASMVEAVIRERDETVVLLSHKKADSYIHIDVEFGEGEGKIPVDKIVQRAEKYKPKERVTYKRIKEYVLEKYGFKVHTAYIAEVKRSLGLPMYDAPNAVEELKQARKHPTPEKVEAIKDALCYFAVI